MFIALMMVFIVSAIAYKLTDTKFGNNAFGQTLIMFYFSWFVVPTWADTFSIWREIIEMWKYKLLG